MKRVATAVTVLVLSGFVVLHAQEGFENKSAMMQSGKCCKCMKKNMKQKKMKKCKKHMKKLQERLERIEKKLDRCEAMLKKMQNK